MKRSFSPESIRRAAIEHLGRRISLLSSSAGVISASNNMWEQSDRDQVAAGGVEVRRLKRDRAAQEGGREVTVNEETFRNVTFN